MLYNVNCTQYCTLFYGYSTAHCSIHSVLYTVTLYMVLYTVTLYTILYTIHCKKYTILYTAHCIMYCYTVNCIVHCSQYTVLCTFQCKVYCTQYCALYIPVWVLLSQRPHILSSFPRSGIDRGRCPCLDDWRRKICKAFKAKCSRILSTIKRITSDS